MKLAIFVLSLLCIGTASENAYAAKAKEPPKLADVIDGVRPSVVQVIVMMVQSPGHPFPQLSDTSPLGKYFNHSPRLIIGTGFFVNRTGDVVTAFHVVDGFRARDGSEVPGIKKIIDALSAQGIHAEIRIGVALPDVETGRITIAAGTEGFPAVVVATDPSHDLALIRPTVNPFTNMPRTFGGPGAAGLPQATAKSVTFSLTRPRDAEEIFACGYPFGESGLVTTSGTLASAWNSQILVRSEAAGFPYAQEVYTVDLRINPGNSGGPVFRMSDQAVIGVAVQSLGTLGVVVPSKFVTAFLTSQGVSWNPGETSSKKPK